jgi:hypothetical protein
MTDPDEQVLIPAADLDVLLAVARLYLQQLDQDPGTVGLSPEEAAGMTAVRDVVARWDVRG